MLARASQIFINGGGIFENAADSNGSGICAFGGANGLSHVTIDGPWSLITWPARTEAACIVTGSSGNISTMNAVSGAITGYSAKNGGGVHTGNTTYSNLTTGSGAAFSGNTASAAFVPPSSAAALQSNIFFASASIANHPLNNYDIKFISG